MANTLYDKAREAFLKGEIDWLTDTIKVVLVDTGDYTTDLTAHDYLDDVPVAARVAVATLSGKTATNGVADADDVTFSAVTGDECEALVLYKDTGTESTSPLIAYLDEGINLPVTPNGEDIVVQWSDVYSRIFKL
jgi:hypothetical protein